MNTTMSNKVAPSENGYVRDEPKEVYKIAFNKYDDFLIAYHSEDGNDNYIITKGKGNNCDFTINKTDFGTPAGNPDRQILESKNATYAEVVERVKSTESGIGFNALTEEYVDMVKAGIVDPAKVTRSALQNAASIAALVLTTESIVADKVDENAPMMPPMPPMGGMGGMM